MRPSAPIHQYIFHSILSSLRNKTPKYLRLTPELTCFYSDLQSVTADLSLRMMMMTSPPTEKMKKKPPKDSLTLLPCFYFVELPIVASSMVSLYFLELTDVVQPAQVGFRCHDRDLSMPYVDEGDELIPLLMLLSLAFAGPAASIMLVEGAIYCLQSHLKIHRSEGSINAGGCSFNSFLRRTVRFVGVHVFGLCATALLTDIIQLATGYHAPFFLTVCKPNYTLAGASCDQNIYITKDICSGHDQHAIMTARRTFPSQHATLSAFAAVYVSMYFNSTISDSTKLLKPVLVFMFAMASALTGLTQITQHRSHPIDVYVGFLIGAFIAAYLAFHAVANFKSSDDVIQTTPPPPPKKDPLRALTERGHESVYHKGPASASESNDEIAAAPAPLDRLEVLGSLQREKGSMGSLKRASADIELLAPRSPMGKETMLTFSNTLPRASMNANGALCSTETPAEPVQVAHPVQRRLKAVQVPLDPMRSQQLVSEWKQKSMEMRGVGPRDEEEPSEDGSEAGSTGTDDTGSQAPIYQPSVQTVRVSSSRNPTPPPGGAKAVVTPRPPQIPEAGPPPVSPKSALTRAKWLSIREKAGGEVSGRSAANQPRLMQVIAMSKQQGLLPSSETVSTCSGTSSMDSPLCRTSSENQREGPGIITVDAHAPHHPLVQAPPPPQAPPLAGNGNSWDWMMVSNGDDPRDSYDLNKRNGGNSSARGSSFGPRRSASPAATIDPSPALPHPQVAASADAQRREMAMRRKTALVLLDREIRNQTEQENYYKSLQGRRFKE
ncbi:lipid phosphate phosphatase-related protein type 3 isoform X2 [Austrofundulus limnaeus]|uniref:Phospholipid phosphatase-related protein type 3 n=1 Tax=Austrofundulus limnaeus TaxID=52670 RepID=A0A2I4CPY0_AUSLI|nr:PREDICTED: lipid phosphate phosphatase-related protein type 3-like isoform X2 [Austrofundulus limnaeus]